MHIPKVHKGKLSKYMLFAPKDENEESVATPTNNMIVNKNHPSSHRENSLVLPSPVLSSLNQYNINNEFKNKKESNNNNNHLLNVNKNDQNMSEDSKEEEIGNPPIINRQKSAQIQEGLHIQVLKKALKAVWDDKG